LQVQTLEYFRGNYGNRALTVMHRMRTWYNQQARSESKKGHEQQAQTYSAYADVMTSRIEEFNSSRNTKFMRKAA
jgi:hypothetical protein